MRSIAIDDELNALKVIELYADKVSSLDLLATFTNPVEAAVFLENNDLDLIFLDINMQLLDGFELLESLTVRPLVIFTTAYSEYAVKSYSVDAIDYLMKPITFSRFLKAINKAEGYLYAEDKEKPKNELAADQILSLKSGTLIHRIRLNDIQYLEADGNYIKFVTPVETIMVLCTMKEALLKVDGNIIRTHRSYAVAKSKVNKVDRHEVTIGDRKIPIGASYRKEVIDCFS